MAMKRFGVNITRTISLDQTIYVKSKNEDDANERVQAAFDAGSAGSAHIDFRGAQGIFRDPEGSEIDDEIEFDDTYEEED